MKKKIINIITIASIIIIIILAIILITKLNTKNNLHELSYNEVLEKIENKETFVLCISRTTCSHCNSYKPKLKKISSNYNIDIYYIDIDLYTKEEQNDFNTRLSFDGSTPTTVFLINGEEKTTSSRLIGNVSYDKIIDKLKKNGFIDE